MLAIFGFAMLSCLAVNDAVKVVLIKRLIPTAVA
jgi:H+-transporting ATPase